MRNRISLIAGVIALGTTAACADHPITTPEPGRVARPVSALRGTTISILTECVADATTGELTCGRSRPALGAGLYDIAADQLNKVKVSGILSCGATTCSADVQLRNEMSQPFGTADGTTLDANGVRTYIGTVSPATGTVTTSGPNAADGSLDCSLQTAECSLGVTPFYQFDEILQPFTLSGPRTFSFDRNGADITAFTVTVVGKIPEEGTGVMRRWVTDIVGSPTPSTQNIFSVWGRNQQNVFAVGDGGRAWRLTTATCPTISSNVNASCTWTENSIPTGVSVSLRTVWGDPQNGNEVYASGAGNTILMFGRQAVGAGNTWRKLDLTGTALDFGTTPTTWFGSWGDATNVCFTATTTQPNNATRMYFAGGVAGLGGRIGRFQGATCNMASGASLAQRQSVISLANVSPAPGSSQLFTGIYGLTTNGVQRIYAVGTTGIIYVSTDGTNFAPEASGTTNNLYQVWGIDAPAATGQVRTFYAMGRNNATGAGVLLRREIGINGNTTNVGWTDISASLPATNQYYWGMFGIAANDLYVSMGGGDVAHFNGSTWLRHSTGQASTLYGLWMTTAGGSPRLFGVGSNGRAIRGIN